MGYRTKRRMIAGFILVVLSSSTIMGFACSAGLDMGYNSQHHQVSRNTHCGTSHATTRYSDTGYLFTSGKTDCCVKHVSDLILSDKASVGFIEIDDLHSFNYYIYSDSFPFELSDALSRDKVKFQFLRRSTPLHHNDIRVYIRSFQI